jgi:hypothetical protein
LVVAGFLLTSVNWWFLLLAAVGTFGPGVLRELGWLRDQDEFQRQAAHRAGYHAFLVAGLAGFVLVAYFRSAERDVRDAQELAMFFLAVLWFTWFLSSLLEYWGPRKTAARVLMAFGAAWLAFTILSNVGNEWTGWTALLLHPLLTLPFFALAWLSRRWPRAAGVLLLCSCALFAQLLGVFRLSNLELVTRAITYVLFLGPLLASGVALLTVRDDFEPTNDRVSMAGSR